MNNNVVSQNNVKNIKAVILFFNGFEDSEGIVTRDILIRAGIDTYTASIDEKKVITSKKMCVLTDFLLDEIVIDDYNFLVIPGGKVENISDNKKVLEFIKKFYAGKKDIYAICAAPYIIGKLGFLRNKFFTCYPGFEKKISNGIFVNKKVVCHDNIITAKSMFYTIDFALAILEKNIGKKKTSKIKKELKGL